MIQNNRINSSDPLEVFTESLKSKDKQTLLDLAKEIEAEPQDENEITVGEFLLLIGQDVPTLENTPSYSQEEVLLY